MPPPAAPSDFVPPKRTNPLRDPPACAKRPTNSQEPPFLSDSRSRLRLFFCLFRELRLCVDFVCNPFLQQHLSQNLSRYTLGCVCAAGSTLSFFFFPFFSSFSLLLLLFPPFFQRISSAHESIRQRRKKTHTHTPSDAPHSASPPPLTFFDSFLILFSPQILLF